MPILRCVNKGASVRGRVRHSTWLETTDDGPRLRPHEEASRRVGENRSSVSSEDAGRRLASWRFSAGAAELFPEEPDGLRAVLHAESTLKNQPGSFGLGLIE